MPRFRSIIKKESLGLFFVLVGLTKPGFNNIQGGHTGETAELRV